mgnify:CR=1 FL=1
MKNLILSFYLLFLPIISYCQNFGFGTSNPLDFVSIGINSQLRVDSFGNIKRINDVPYSFPTLQGGIGSVLTNNGNGLLTWGSGSGVLSLTAGTGITLSNNTGAITISSSGGGGGGLSGGLTNFITKWTSASSLGSSSLFDNGTNIYVGSLSQAYNKFEVNVTNFDAIVGRATGINWGVSGFSTLNGTGVYGENNGTGYGVFGSSTSTVNAGVTGQNTKTGYGVSGFSTSGIGVLGIGGTHGVYGGTSSSTSYGTLGFNSNAVGTAVIGIGNNLTLAGATLAAGSGGSFKGLSTGLVAVTSSTGESQAIYTLNNGAPCRVNYFNGTTQYKILGTGTVSTVVDGLNGEKVTLHCSESPEIYFEDYGEGKLLNGKVRISIDPIFAKNVTVNEKHPLRVFIQLEGNCNGVYVTNKSVNSFDIVELNNGKSNVSFQWHIVCNRADEVLGTKISRNADVRFERASPDLEIMNGPAIEIMKAPAIVERK